MSVYYNGNVCRLTYLEFDQKYFKRGGKVGTAYENKGMLETFVAGEFDMTPYFVRVH